MKSRRALSFHLGVFLSSGLLALLVYSTCNAQTFLWVQPISTNTTTDWSPGLWSPAGGPNAADHIGSFEITGSGGTLTVNNTPTITLGGISTTATNSRSLNINGGVMTLSTTTGTPTFNLAGTGGPIITISSQLSGTQGFVKTGGLRLGLNGNNSGLSGPISINAGSIALGHNNALGTGTVTLAGGQLNGAFNGVRTVANNFVVNSGNFTQDTTNGLVNQAILRVNGTTQVNLSSGNLFAAAANAGTIQLIHFNNTVSGGSAGNSFTINNGADNGNVGAIFSSANSFAHNIILSQGGVSPTDGLGKRGSVGLVGGNDTAFSTANITIQSGVHRSYLASSDSTARTL